MSISEKVVVLSGPSGCGKGTVLDELNILCGDRIHVARSVTTRAPRSSSEDGYFFVTKEQFHSLMEQNRLLETNLYSGSRHLYGTLRSELETGAECTILEIDVNGLMQLRACGLFPEKGCLTGIFLAPPSAEELLRRLRGRNTESPETILSRLKTAVEEVAQLHRYDHVLITDVPAQDTAQNLMQIIFGDARSLSPCSFDPARFIRDTEELLRQLESAPIR